jgi:hypothetical protein
MKKLLLLTFICFASFIYSQEYDPIEIQVICPTGHSEDTLCYDIIVSNFYGVTGIQFTMNFNPYILKPLFSQNNLNFPNSLLPNLGSWNFSLSSIAFGRIFFLWFESSPVNSPDESLLFTLCFEAIGNPGESAFLNISNDPIPLEIISINPTTGNVYTNLDVIVDNCHHLLHSHAPRIVSKFCSSSENESNGQIWFYGAGGTPPYQYSLFFNGIVIESDENTSLETISRNGLPIGIYSIVLKDAEDNWAPSVTMEITTENPISFDLLSQNPSCFSRSNGHIEITNLTGGNINHISDYRIEWSNDIFNKLKNQNIRNGTYKVSVSDLNGCIVEKESMIFVDTLYAHFEILEPASCSTSRDGKILFSAEGGTPSKNGEYRFRLNTVFTNGSDTLLLTNINAGLNRFRVLDFASPSCATDEILIDMPMMYEEFIVLDSFHITDATCFGYEDGSVEAFASALTGDVTFHWNNGNTGSLNTDLPAGSHKVTIRGINDCFIEQHFTINQNPEIIIENIQITPASRFNIPDGEIEVDLSGGIGLLTLIWRNGSGDSISDQTHLTDLIHGIYSLEITDEAGCTQRFDNIIVGPASHISEDKDLNFLYYPNPFTNLMHIETSLWHYHINIYDTVGRLCHRSTQKGNSTIDLKYLTPGQYILHILSATGNYSFLVNRI